MVRDSLPWIKRDRIFHGSEPGDVSFIWATIRLPYLAVLMGSLPIALLCISGERGDACGSRSGRRKEIRFMSALDVDEKSLEPNLAYDGAGRVVAQSGIR